MYLLIVLLAAVIPSSGTRSLLRSFTGHEKRRTASQTGRVASTKTADNILWKLRIAEQNSSLLNQKPAVSVGPFLEKA